MNEFNLRKCLKNRLKVRKNKEYLDFFRHLYIGKHPHHTLGSQGHAKLNDLLLVSKTFDEHDNKHHHVESEEEFLNDFLEALENLFNYVEYLQGKK